MSDRVKVVQIAPEHLRARSWIAYRLDTPLWIDEIKGFLENDDNAELRIQVVEMEEAEFEDLPEYENP
jgi:tRNA threonylcarbamoyladenosine modification (KEOPS) complex Cgi121 subunit